MYRTEQVECKCRERGIGWKLRLSDLSRWLVFFRSLETLSVMVESLVLTGSVYHLYPLYRRQAGASPFMASLAQRQGVLLPELNE